MSACNLPVIHVGDVGVKLRLLLVDEEDEIIPITTATTKEITVSRPDGTTFTRAAAFVTDGADGEMEIESEAGDFPVPSPNYRMQGHVVMGDLDVRSDIKSFPVERNL